MSPAFPLLRLPSLALSEVLKIASPSEVISLSLCSEKCRKRVQTWRDKSIDWEIELIDRRRPTVCLVYKDVRIKVLGAFIIENAIKSSEVLKIKESKVPVTMKSNYLVTFWEGDKWRDGFKLIANYVMGFFEKPVHRVNLHWENRWVIEWINERQTERLRDGYIEAQYNKQHNTPVANEDFHETIEMFTPTRSLLLHVKPSDTFQYTGKVHNADNICIDFGTWITIDYLLAINPISIFVGFSMLSCSDMNVYIKHWLDGRNRKLKHAQFHIRGDASFEQLIDGFAEKAVDVPRIRQYKAPHGEVQEFRGYDITREDGVTASISLGLIVVWPDLDENYN